MKGEVCMFRSYVQSMMAGRPYQIMMDADKGGGGGDPQDPQDPPKDPENPDDPQDPQDPDNPEDKDKDDPIKFTDEQQAEINKIVARTIAKERSKAEAERKKAEERAKMSAEEKAEADRKDREEKVKEREEKANARIINMELRDIARDQGVSAKKLERFLKVVDRDGLEVDEDGGVDRTKAEQAVKAVLADMPEFKGPSSPRGPGGEFDKGAGGGAKFTISQIQAMSNEEIAKNWDDVQKSMAIHNKK
jgi:hypothetical protein